MPPRKGGTKNRMETREHQKLRGKIIELFGSQGAFAKAIGKTEQSVTAKLNGRTQFSQGDIIEWSNALLIGVDDVGSYFFANKL